MSSTTTYRGRLTIPGDAFDLVVDLRFENESLEVRTLHESLGRWPISEVHVFQLESGVFSMRLGAEEALFAAADPEGFALRAIPARFRGRHLRTAVDTNLNKSG
jgi:hypothetical protein